MERLARQQSQAVEELLEEQQAAMRELAGLAGARISLTAPCVRSSPHDSVAALASKDSLAGDSGDAGSGSESDESEDVLLSGDSDGGTDGARVVRALDGRAGCCPEKVRDCFGWAQARA